MRARDWALRLSVEEDVLNRELSCLYRLNQSKNESPLLNNIFIPQNTTSGSGESAQRRDNSGFIVLVYWQVMRIES